MVIIKLRELTGQKFNELLVVKKSENLKDRVAWICLCDCGETTIVRSSCLTSGLTKSCGHNLSENSIAKRKKENDKFKDGRLVRIYHNMKQRCLNPNNKQYPDYGGRGIKICKEWLGEKGLNNFYTWANKNGYNNKLTIDRINVNKGYTPNNCRWATTDVQGSNKRNTVYLSVLNERKTIPQWSKKLNIPQNAIRRLLDAETFNKKILKSITNIEYMDGKLFVNLLL